MDDGFSFTCTCLDEEVRLRGEDDVLDRIHVKRILHRDDTWVWEKRRRR